MLGWLEVYRSLPKKNCGDCGYDTCTAFAAAFAGRKVKTAACPYLKEAKYEIGLKKLMKIEAEFDRATETGLIIHAEKCFGCGNCVIACPVNVAAEPMRCGIGLGPETDKAILYVENGTVKCDRPHNCRRYGPGGINCNACIATCPSKAIEFV